MTKNDIMHSAKNLIKTDIKKEDLMQIFALMSGKIFLINKIISDLHLKYVHIS